MGEALALVEEEYVEPADRAKLLEGSLRGLVAGLDPHSSYLDPESYGIFLADTEGRFGGIGVEVDLTSRGIVVLAPLEGSPAARAGVLPGDRIVAIDGVAVRERPPEALMRSMRGEPGSVVELVIERDGRDTPLELALTRELVHVPSVTGQRLEGGVGYLRLKQFQTGTHTEFLEQLAKLRVTGGPDGAREPLRGVLIDLRNNPGGLVREAAAVADELLDGGVVYTTRHRGELIGGADASAGGALTELPLVVLVNGASASAAELVAGALQDHDRAPLVGSRTYGKGSVQTILDLEGGAGLRLTTMRYYTPRGHAVQARGIEPTLVVPAQVAADARGGLVREADVPGALPQDGPGATPAPLPSANALGAASAAPAVGPPSAEGAKPADQAARDSEAAPATLLGVARVVPANPRGGPDVALATAYELLLGRLVAERPAPPTSH